LNLKIPLDMVSTRYGYKKLLHYTIQHEGSRHVDFREMSISPGQTMTNNLQDGFQPTCRRER